MRIKKLSIAVVTVLIVMASPVFAADKMAGVAISSPVGYWKIMNTFTGKPERIVQVFRNSDQVLMAKVVKVFSKHDQPAVGKVIISGLKSVDRQWTNGKILDTENGKTYKCTARLMEHGKKLNVKGYTGLPLFGHSQTWERVDLMSG